MPTTAFFNTHVLVVVLFLLLFIVKAFLLFTNKRQALENIRNKTKVLDIIFGILILATGGYLIFQYKDVPTWLIVKVLLVLVAIPLGIIGIKKYNKPLTALSLLLFLYVYGVAETKNLNMKKAKQTETISAENATVSEEKAAPAIAPEMTATALTNAKAIYNQLCISCHGEDGKKGTSNAADLSVSNLSLEEHKTIILKGKGLMPSYQGQITEQEAEELAAYTQTLKK
jgi:mono/diheme cytochrome c family protein